MMFSVRPDGPDAVAGRLRLAGRAVRCALGKGGARPAADKREGDGATPIGAWPFRAVYFRADRLAAPASALPLRAIREDDGWCDDPNDPAYNRPVTLPYPASAERLWREDGVYDVVVVLGYNDAPPRPGRGSAIFLHVARPAYAPTEGCVALALADLLALLAIAAPGDGLEVTAPRPSPPRGRARQTAPSRP